MTTTDVVFRNGKGEEYSIDRTSLFDLLMFAQMNNWRPAGVILAGADDTQHAVQEGYGGKLLRPYITSGSSHRVTADDAHQLAMSLRGGLSNTPDCDPDPRNPSLWSYGIDRLQVEQLARFCERSGEFTIL